MRLREKPNEVGAVILAHRLSKQGHQPRTGHRLTKRVRHQRLKPRLTLEERKEGLGSPGVSGTTEAGRRSPNYLGGPIDGLTNQLSTE